MKLHDRKLEIPFTMNNVIQNRIKLARTERISVNANALHHFEKKRDEIWCRI